MSILFNISALVGAIGTLTTARVGIMTSSLTSRLERRRDQKEGQAAARRDLKRRTRRVLNLVVQIHSEAPFPVVLSRRLARQAERMIQDLGDPAFEGRSSKQKLRLQRTLMKAVRLQKLWAEVNAGAGGQAAQRRAEALYEEVHRNLSAIIAKLGQAERPKYKTFFIRLARRKTARC